MAADAARLKEAWANWIADMGEWHVFGALTYDQRRRPAVPSRDVAMAHARRWLRESAKAPGCQVEAAVVALEYQRNGWPHFHPLVRVSAGVRPGLFGTLGQLWFRRHGYARLEQPRDRMAVAGYATKYLMKDLSRGDVILWPPRGPLTTHQPALAAIGDQVEERRRG